MVLSQPNYRRRLAFSIIELLIVFAIIGLLVSLLLPAIQHLRESARRVQCLSRQRQFALGNMLAADAKRSRPHSSVEADSPSDQRMWGTFAVDFCVETSVYPDKVRAFHVDNQSRLAAKFASLTCPSGVENPLVQGCSMDLDSPVDPQVTFSTIDYMLNGGVTFDPFPANPRPEPFAVNYSQHRLRSSQVIPDGTSNSIHSWESVGGASLKRDRARSLLQVRDWTPFAEQALIFEGGLQVRNAATGAGYLHFYRSHGGTMTGFVEVVNYVGANGQFIVRYLTDNSYGSPFSLHPGGISVAYIDGSTKSMTDDIDFDVLKSLLYINDEN